MTDKVQLIKEEIERQIEFGKTKCQQSQENNDQESYIAWSEHIATCGKLLLFIDSIPEENHFEDKSEMVSEDLEEVANQHSKQVFHGLLVEDNITAFKVGAEWQKQQMMKDAVETTIVNDWQYGKDPDHAIIPAIHQRIEGFNIIGDKVKIIIVKPEQQ